MSRLSSLRSLLFTPAGDERKLARALESEADAVIADLEDATAPAQKVSARETLARSFPRRAGGPARFVRVNGFDTAFYDGDVALLDNLELDGVVLPKATPEGVSALAATGLPIVALVETAIGLRLAYEIASTDGVFALLLGAFDLGAELGLEPRPDGLELQYARSKLVVDSAAAGIRAPFDAVHVQLHDAEGLRHETELARSLGFRGKSCIHPAQLAIVNAAFMPSVTELEWAHGVIAAASSAEDDGRGAFALDGAMVDAPVVLRARRLVAESERAR